MPLFEYTARNLTGERIQGVLNGASEQAVLGELEARQLTPVSIQTRRERARLSLRVGGSGGGRGGGGGVGRVPIRRLAGSYIQVSDLLRAGVPLLRSLKLLGNRKGGGAGGGRANLAAVYTDLAEGVARGEELAEAMSRHPGIFPRVHLAMVRAGEKGGFLEQVMARLGQFVMAQAEMRSKVIGSLAYPALLVVAGIGILAVIFALFIPKFKPLFIDMPDLPLTTRLVFGVSDVLSAYGLVLLAVLAIAGIIAWRLGQRPGVRRWASGVKTRAPIIGPLVRNLAAARFCRMLGTMLGNGIAMLTAMQIAKEAAGNLLMEEAIDKAADAVRAGATLAGPLNESGLFSDDVIEMIGVAETANNLDEVLITIAQTIESRIDRMLSTAIRLIEPLLLLSIAGVVVVVAAGLILPMTKLKAGF